MMHDHISLMYFWQHSCQLVFVFIKSKKFLYLTSFIYNLYILFSESDHASYVTETCNKIKETSPALRTLYILTYTRLHM